MLRDQAWWKTRQWVKIRFHVRMEEVPYLKWAETDPYSQVIQNIEKHLNWGLREFTLGQQGRGRQNLCKSPLPVCTTEEEIIPSQLWFEEQCRDRLRSMYCEPRTTCNMCYTPRSPRNISCIPLMPLNIVDVITVRSSWHETQLVCVQSVVCVHSVV